MPTYQVTLRSLKDSSKTREVFGIEALSAESAKAISETQGWKPVAAKIMARSGKGAKPPKPFPKKEMVLLCKSMAGMIKARIKTVEALNFYANNLPDAGLKTCLRSVASQIEAGEEPYKAFETTKRFDSTFVGLVRAGTLSGNLAAALLSMAHRIKTDLIFKSKIRKAIALPCGIVVFLLGAFIFSQLKLVPMVEKMLTDINMEPDGFSAVVFQISHVVKLGWIPFVLAFVAAAVTLIKSYSLRNSITNLVMSKWRLVRELVMGVRQLNFLGTLHMLTSNNIPVEDALDTCAKVMKGTPFELEIIEAKRRYGLGNSLADSIRRYTSCDDTVSHMIEVGERVADIDEQLKLLVEMYEERTAERMEEFTTAVTLIGMIVTVAIMGFVYLSAYMPIILAGPKMMQGTSM